MAGIKLTGKPGSGGNKSGGGVTDLWGMLGHALNTGNADLAREAEILIRAKNPQFRGEILKRSRDLLNRNTLAALRRVHAGASSPAEYAKMKRAVDVARQSRELFKTVFPKKNIGSIHTKLFNTLNREFKGVSVPEDPAILRQAQQEEKQRLRQEQQEKNRQLKEQHRAELITIRQGAAPGLGVVSGLGSSGVAAVSKGNLFELKKINKNLDKIKHDSDRQVKILSKEGIPTPGTSGYAEYEKHRRIAAGVASTQERIKFAQKYNNPGRWQNFKGSLSGLISNPYMDAALAIGAGPLLIGGLEQGAISAASIYRDTSRGFGRISRYGGVPYGAVNSGMGWARAGLLTGAEVAQAMSNYGMPFRSGADVRSFHKALRYGRGALGMGGLTTQERVELLSQGATLGAVRAGHDTQFFKKIQGAFELGLNRSEVLKAIEGSMRVVAQNGALGIRTGQIAQLTGNIMQLGIPGLRTASGATSLVGAAMGSLGQAGKVPPMAELLYMMMKGKPIRNAAQLRSMFGVKLTQKELGSPLLRDFFRSNNMYAQVLALPSILSGSPLSSLAKVRNAYNTTLGRGFGDSLLSTEAFNSLILGNKSLPAAAAFLSGGHIFSRKLPKGKAAPPGSTIPGIMGNTAWAQFSVYLGSKYAEHIMVRVAGYLHKPVTEFQKAVDKFATATESFIEKNSPLGQPPVLHPWQAINKLFPKGSDPYRW